MAYLSIRFVFQYAAFYFLRTTTSEYYSPPYLIAKTLKLHSKAVGSDKNEYVIEFRDEIMSRTRLLGADEEMTGQLWHFLVRYKHQQAPTHRFGVPITSLTE